MNVNKVILVILTITIPYLILIGNLYFYLYNETFYYKEFNKNNVNVKDKELILDNLLNFFKDKNELKYFNEKESSHLADVKNLIDKFISVFYFLIILDMLLFTILFIKYKKILIKNIKKTLLYSGILTIAVILVFILLSLNFDFLFDNFHILFFAGNWLFPEDSLLIQLFPFNFFYDYFLKILINSFIISLILILISLLLKKKIKKN